MSAYVHQMEQQYSGRSLLSRGSSENESRNTMETGIYMSYFAATVFIAGLVTVGVSLMTLLISLTVMLQSCQSRNAGVVQMQKSPENYDYCRILASHVELNHLDSDSFPSVCKEIALKFVRDGHYMRELNITMTVVDNYFSSITPGEDRQSLVLMDADDFLPSEHSSIDQLLHQFNQYTHTDCHKDARHLKQIFVHELYTKLRGGGWPLILLSRKPERLRNSTEKYLISAGCGGWSSLIMRLDDELRMDSQEYLSRRRTIIHRQGFRTVAAISSQLDFLTGSQTGGLNFKLPGSAFSDIMDHYPENSSC